MCSFRSILVALLLLCAGYAGAAESWCNVDSLLHVLDGIVAGKEHLEEAKQMKIAECRRNLQNARGDSATFDALGEMFLQYRKYRLDSALHYARLRVKVAKAMGKPDSVASAMMNVADGLKGLSRFHESEQVLKDLPQSPYVTSSEYYYYLWHSVTLSIYNELKDDSTHVAYYVRRLRNYRDSLLNLNIAVNDASGYAVSMSDIYVKQGRYDEALQLLTDIRVNHPEMVDDDAIFWCTLADVYGIKGDRDAEIYCLAMGAIIDKRNCIKTYMSLPKLALLLNETGDTERAYRYLSCVIKDVMDGNARSRLLQVSQYTPIILDGYEQLQERERRTRVMFNVVVVVLVILLAIIAVQLCKRNMRLTEMHNCLDAKNRELSSLNDELKEANRRLGDSNKIKEAYIGQLFKICTEYIDDMDKFRMSLSRKLKVGQVADVKKQLDHPVAEEAMKDFFKKFDVIFLELFPTFVEDFNKLLQPGNEIYPKENKGLTTELRIYALVRLGINDSTKIASFLHYSPQTIYNYRQKVRNRSSIPKGKFVEAVQNL